MSCSINEIKKDSIDLAINTFMEGNSNMERVSDAEVYISSNYQLNKGDNFNSFAGKQIDRVKKIMSEKFGEKFSEGWVKFAYDNGNLGRTYKFSFPKELEEAYNIKLNNVGLTPQQSQERLNQIQEVFNENPELANIGTIEQYSQYLSTIFPNSKVKNIVYRGGNLGTKQPQDVEAFTTNKSYAEYRAAQNKAQVYPAILNIQESKLLDKKEIRTLSLDRDEFEYQDYGFTDNKDQTKQLGNFYTVKENNRHILGSKQDIENFANFVAYENSDFSKIGNINQFRDYIMSKNFAAIEEFLVVNNKIDRKC